MPNPQELPGDYFLERSPTEQRDLIKQMIGVLTQLDAMLRNISTPVCQANLAAWYRGRIVMQETAIAECCACLREAHRFIAENVPQNGRDEILKRIWRVLCEVQKMQGLTGKDPETGGRQ